MLQFSCNPSTNCVIQFAQKQLQHYLTKMLPTNTQATILLDFKTTSLQDCAVSPTNSALDDGFQIKASATTIEILAKNPRSVLLGVYRFLYQLGCRFLMPGKKHEIIPKISLNNLEIVCKEIPSFRHRGVCIEGADSLENILDFIDWLPKVGFNTFFCNI